MYNKFKNTVFTHVSYAVSEMLLLFGLYIFEALLNKLHNNFRKHLCGKLVMIVLLPLQKPSGKLKAANAIGSSEQHYI